MINVYGDGNANCPDFIIIHYIHVLNYHTVPHKSTQLEKNKNNPAERESCK
jgi:hypothetical protein